MGAERKRPTLCDNSTSGVNYASIISRYLAFYISYASSIWSFEGTRSFSSTTCFVESDIRTRPGLSDVLAMCSENLICLQRSMSNWQSWAVASSPNEAWLPACRDEGDVEPHWDLVFITSRFQCRWFLLLPSTRSWRHVYLPSPRALAQQLKKCYWEPHVRHSGHARVSASRQQWRLEGLWRASYIIHRELESCWFRLPKLCPGDSVDQ